MPQAEGMPGSEELIRCETPRNQRGLGCQRKQEIGDHADRQDAATDDPADDLPHFLMAPRPPQCTESHEQIGQ